MLILPKEKSNILKENKNKSGIYRFTNKTNGNIYIGSSKNLGNRFSNYFNLSYISKIKNNLTISRALIKYGYLNFTRCALEILEYCDVSDLLVREQFYLDLLKPKYNIAKIAGSTIGIQKSQKIKNLISKSLKSFHSKNKSPLLGKKHTKETKELMSIFKLNENNPMFGKLHTKKLKN